MKLSGVGKRFGSRTVLRDISLEIFPGTVTLLAGANGAGKSTLMCIMAGLARPTTGSVSSTFEEAAVQKDCASPKGGVQEKKEKALTAIGYLGHATFIYPGLSALENLAFWGSLHGRDTRRENLLATLKRVELGRYAEERAGAFSRGMAQRLNLARILLLAPRLLLLDEPGTGLDMASQGMLRAEIAQARTRGAAVVWISHDVSKDAASADRLLSLADRRIVYDGPPDAEPAASGTQALRPQAAKKETAPEAARGGACRDSA